MTDSPEGRRRALVSVSDKTGLEEFAKGLVGLGFEIVSTGGTRRFLEDRGVSVVDVSSYTGFPEIMDGRVKTLHPKVHGAILGRPDQPGDAAAIREHDIVPFELVVCNLYPFKQTIARDGVSVAEAVEQIDIGGPSMIRSAAKNHAYVAVVVDSSQFPRVLDGLRAGAIDDVFRRELATAAFRTTARYDRAVADYFAKITAGDDANSEDAPESLRLEFKRKAVLRYGENPHQRAAFYVEPDSPAGALAAAEQRHGKELSYNNLLDLDAALGVVREFSDPACVVIKHTNPCGCAIAETLEDAFVNAYAGDPVSAFGSILGFNRPLDVATAERLCEPNRFIEAIIAPNYDDEAFAMLTSRPKWKNNVRLLRCRTSALDEPAGRDYRRVTGGLLVQDRDASADVESEWKSVADRTPTEAETRDLRFGWRVCKHVKSNAIVFVKNAALVGVGAGQMSRLDSSFIAGHKAGERSSGAVLASDAFFPFRDGVDEAAKAGVTAVIQPGGSRNDEEVVAAANEHGLAMIFTGRRHFRH